jgi:hypothetical protein
MNPGHNTAMFNPKIKLNSIEGGTFRQLESTNSFRSEFIETMDEKRSQRLGSHSMQELSPKGNASLPLVSSPKQKASNQNSF